MGKFGECLKENGNKMEMLHEFHVGEYGELEFHTKYVNEFIEFLDNNGFNADTPSEIITDLQSINSLYEFEQATMYNNQEQNLFMEIYRDMDTTTSKIIVFLYHFNFENDYNGDNYEYRNKEYVTKAIERFNNLLEK